MMRPRGWTAIPPRNLGDRSDDALTHEEVLRKVRGILRTRPGYSVIEAARYAQSAVEFLARESRV